ncbi:MAG: GntR family transcriptional regulator [Thermoanaerobacterales bacterium]|nr:GntR family transcriptional regulator [Thermoanaerobacterales bacterium]
MRLDFDLTKPIYLQIVDEIKRAVARGELAPGDRIPSLRELAQQARVNPNTVQRAFQEMERSGLTETLRGQGTFIRGDPGLVERMRNEMAGEALEAFVKEMSALGFGPDEIRRLVEDALADKTERGDAGVR